MGHFSNPLVVTAKPEENAVRVSVRASESRIDEWTISAEDVASVLNWDNSNGWRGAGNLKVLLDRTGGSVSFRNGSGDRAIIRGPESMAYSFLAHLQAAYDTLPLEPVETVSVVRVASSQTRSATESATPEALTAIQQQVAQNHSELLSTIAGLAAAVQTALQTPSAPAPVLQSERVPTISDAVFIPSVSTTVEGTGLTADEKTSSADDLAAAAAALRAAKKQTTST